MKARFVVVAEVDVELMVVRFVIVEEADTKMPTVVVGAKYPLVKVH